MLKKRLTFSLVLALLAAVPVAAVYGEKPVQAEGKGGGGKPDKPGKPEKPEKLEKPEEPSKPEKPEDPGKPDSGKPEKPGKPDKPDTADEPDTAEEPETPEGGTPTDGDGTTTEPPADGTQPVKKKDAVKQAVKTKKELIELRQQLKHATEITEELKAKYEELTAQLEQQSELKQALEVQKELLNRFYKPGDTELLAKLGELYEKAGETGLKTFVNGTEVEMDVKPFVEKGRALVPVRAISKALKAEVKWDAASRMVEVVRGDAKITLYLDKNEALVNGATVKLETAPVLKNGRVFLPLRFIGEQLKANVSYQDKGDLIIVDDTQPATGSEPATGTEPTNGTEPTTGTGETAPTDETTATTPATEEGTTGTVTAP